MKTAAEVIIEAEDRGGPDPLFDAARAETVDRLAAILRPEPPPAGRPGPVEELCAAQLDETLEVIIGNLCRDERGLYAACDGNDAERQADLPGIAQIDPAAKEKIGSLARTPLGQAFVSPKNLTVTPQRPVDPNSPQQYVIYHTNWQRSFGFQPINKDFQPVDEDSPDATGYRFVLKSSTKGEPPSEIRLQNEDLARMMGLPSGAKIEYVLGTTQTAEAVTEGDVDHDAKAMLTPHPSAEKYNEFVDALDANQAIVFRGVARYADALGIEGKSDKYLGAIFTTAVLTLEDGVPKLQIGKYVSKSDAAPFQPYMIDFLTDDVRYETFRALGIRAENDGEYLEFVKRVDFEEVGALKEAIVDPPEPEKDEEAYEDTYGSEENNASDTERNREAGVVPDPDLEVSAMQRARDSEEKLAALSREGPYPDRYLYHVTTAAGYVSKEGLMSLEELVNESGRDPGRGLGNPEAEDPLVSLTDDPAVAWNIEQSLRVIGEATKVQTHEEGYELIRRGLTERAEQAKRLGFAFKEVQDPLGDVVDAQMSRWKDTIYFARFAPGSAASVRKDPEAVFQHTFQAWRYALGTEAFLTNPVIVGNADQYKDLDPSEIRTFKVATDARTRRGVDNFNREVEVRPGRTLTLSKPIDWKTVDNWRASGIYNEAMDAVNESAESEKTTGRRSSAMMRRVLRALRAYARRRRAV